MAINLPVFNVKQAGVKGDNATNDTSTLQNALNIAASTGVPALIPAGTYLITSTLTTRVSIMAEPGAVFKANASMQMPMLAVSASNVFIENLDLNGNNLCNGGIQLVSGSSHVTIRDCEVFNMLQLSGFSSETVGIRINSNVHHVLIEGCYLHHLSAPVTGICRGVLANSSGSGGDSTNIMVVNNRFEEIGPVNDGDGIVIQDYTGFVFLTISNNYFKRCYKRSIKVQVNGYTVTGNIIDTPFLGPSKGQIQPYSAISVYNSFGVVSNNTCIIATALNPIEIGVVNAPISNVTVIGNIVRQDKTTADVGNADCIRVYGKADNVIIQGNNLRDGRYGIHMNSNGDGTIVSGNMIDNVDNVAIYIDDNLSGAYPTNLSITGNVLTDCKSTGIAAKSGSAMNGKRVSIVSNVGTTSGKLIDAALLPYVSTAANVGNV